MTPQKWQQLTLIEQLANIGSEVNRALKAQERNDENHLRNALDRALELFDLTISDPRWRGRLKEVLIAREVVIDYFDRNYYKSDSDWLNDYFLHFGMAARLNR